MIFEHVIGEHATHRQGKILHRHADLVVGLFSTDSFKYAVPLLMACHEVILHHLFCLEIAVLPDETPHSNSHHNKGEEGHNRAARSVCPTMTGTTNECEDKDGQGRSPKQHRDFRRIAMVMDA